LTASPDERPARPIVRWLLLLWVATLIAGYVALRSPDALAANNPVSPERAAWTAANVGTLAGFAQQFARPDDFRFTVRVVFLAQLFAAALLTLVGGGIVLGRAVDSHHSDRKIAVVGLGLILLSMGLGLLFAGPQQDAVSAMSRGLGALTGSGLVFGQAPAAGNGLLQALWLPLSVAGLLGVVVLLDLWQTVSNHSPLTPHAGPVLGVTAARYLAVFLPAVALLATTSAGPVGVNELLRASTLGVSASGYGLPVERPGDFPRGLDAVLLVLMLVGPGTLSTAGGLGLAWLVTAPARFRRALEIGLVTQTAIILLAYLLLAQSEPQLSPDRLAMLVVSGGMSVGLSHDPVSITGDGLYTLAGLLIAGRVLPLLVFGVALRQASQYELP
jgi:hypothetical protein